MLQEELDDKKMFNDYGQQYDRQSLRKDYTLPYLSDLLGEYAKGKKVEEMDDFWKDKDQIIQRVEESLSKMLDKIDFDAYSKKDIAQLYESISLRKNVWLSLFDCEDMMKALDFNILKQSRF